MKDTKIGYVHHSFNPWWGCVEVSPGCTNCFARDFAARLGRDLWGTDKPRKPASVATWKEPLKWNRAAQAAGEVHRVLCGTMCDVMEPGPTQDAMRARLWDTIEATPWLMWLLFTKRPHNYQWLLPERWRAATGRDMPANVCGTVSVEDASYAFRVEHLLRVPFRWRALSYEPALGPLPRLDRFTRLHGAAIGLDWVIVGGESGRGARPCDLTWLREARDACQLAGVPVWVKQLGSKPIMQFGVPGLAEYVWLRHKKGEDPSEWPEDLRVQQVPAFPLPEVPQ